MKKLLSTIILILLAGYIVFATIAFCNKPTNEICKGIYLEMRDSSETGYMTTADIAVLLKQNGLDPTGKLIDEVSCRSMEQQLNKVPLIASCECYKTINGYVVVEVECRKPILRVINSSGDSFYIDEEGEVIEHIAKPTYIPIATGHISREFARKELLTLAQYLFADELWNAQIEQIHVTPREEIELIPRVGDHTIVLGRPGNYAYKFSKLRTFYEKGLSQVGWDRYSRINIDYNNQVVGTKKE
ncbi:MAG: cell division protein FtsQ [Bacteroidales bacterium]|jgi:cell division protein FtsQ|nr:cell division protein FtsQ [Bacteroidales bacterium]